MLRYMTAGESHGKGLIAILDGVPAGLKLDESFINADLARRQFGYGRGGRMDIETDTVEIISGICKGVTIGSPVGIFVKNADYKINDLPEVKSPRPGHADLAGIQKYRLGDARCVLERASARETAVRVAIGAVAKLILKQFGIDMISHVTMLGGVEAVAKGLSFDDICKNADIKVSKLRCADKAAEADMCKAIDKAKENGDTLGGTFEVMVKGLPVGLGSYVQWDKRLDGDLARAVMSIPAVKAVSIGEGIAAAALPGSKVHDPIGYDQKNKIFTRSSNNAGGLEGGVTNGQMLRLEGFMKPIATLSNPLSSVDIDTKKEAMAATERSDVTAVSACGVVAEAVCALELASALTDKFGGDSIEEMRRNYEA